jgi:hypothetical protein
MPDSKVRAQLAPGLTENARDGNAPDQEQQVKKAKLVDLTEIRQLAHQDGDTQLTQMNDRELRAAVLENYAGQNATETVIRTRAIDAQGGAR